MKHIAMLLALAIGAAPLHLTAQNGGQKLAIAIQVDSVTIRGDTIGVASKVTNLSSSQEPLLVYMVDAPSGIVQITLPSPASSWDTSNNYRARPMAFWSALGLVPAGTTSPQLSFQSIGVPGILNYWAKGKYRRPANEDVADTATAEDPMTVHMITGQTVGVSPWPVDRSPAGLISRLRALTQSSCSTPLLWITDSSVCSQLTADLDQAETYRANGQRTNAKSTLDHFVGLLSGGSPGTYAPGVTSAGYWLLAPNATIIKALL